MMQENNVPAMDDLAFIYSGLGSVSTEERERLKRVAQSLLAAQNRPGLPLPDNIRQKLLWETTGEIPWTIP